VAVQERLEDPEDPEDIPYQLLGLPEVDLGHKDEAHLEDLEDLEDIPCQALLELLEVLVLLSLLVLLEFRVLLEVWLLLVLLEGRLAEADRGLEHLDLADLDLADLGLVDLDLAGAGREQENQDQHLEA